MSEAQHLSESLIGFLSDAEIGWFTPVVTAIQGLTSERAAKIPAAGFNSVWGVVNHMSYWLEYLLHRLKGEPVEPMAAEGKENWQLIPDPGDEQAWRSACERLFSLNQQMAELVAGLSDPDLETSYAEGRPKRYQVIHGVIAHNCYHTNEIISIRHMLGLWLEQT